MVTTSWDGILLEPAAITIISSFSRVTLGSCGAMFSILPPGKHLQLTSKSSSLTALPRPCTNDEPMIDTLTRRPLRRRPPVFAVCCNCLCRAGPDVETVSDCVAPSRFTSRASSVTSSCRAAKRLLQGIEGTSRVVPAILFVVMEDGLLHCMLTEGLHISVFNLLTHKLILLMLCVSTQLITKRLT